MSEWVSESPKQVSRVRTQVSEQVRETEWVVERKGVGVRERVSHSQGTNAATQAQPLGISDRPSVPSPNAPSHMARAMRTC